MTPKTIKILAGAAVLVVVLALLVVNQDVSATGGDEAAGGALFPQLQADINDAARIAVTGSAGSFEIAKQEGGGWGLADKGGYPVDVGKVRETLIGIANLEKLEPKTRRPEKHSELGLGDPTAPDSTATKVVVTGGSGDQLAAAVLGKKRTYQGAGDRTMYARRANEDQTWEVRGDVRVDATATNWLDKQILKVEPRRIASVAIEHPGGEQLVARKASPEEANYEVQDLPEDAELAWPGAANSLANALNYLNLEDVKPGAAVDFQESPGATATFTCWDGLVVHVETTEHDDRTYARFVASFDESARVEPVGPPAPADDGAVAEDGEDEPEAPAAAEEPELASVEDVRAEVAKLNERLERWAYALPSWTAQNFTKHLEDLLKKDEPPPEVGNADAFGLPDLPTTGPGGAEIPPELRAQLEQMARDAQAQEAAEEAGSEPPEDPLDGSEDDPDAHDPDDADPDDPDVDDPGDDAEPTGGDPPGDSR